MTDAAKCDPEDIERQKVDQLRKLQEDRYFSNQPDHNGITAAMVDKMVAIMAEALSTGQTDVRAIMYCAYREAQKLQPPRGK